MVAQAATCIENGAPSCMLQALKGRKSALRFEPRSANGEVHVQDPA